MIITNSLVILGLLTGVLGIGGEIIRNYSFEEDSDEYMMPSINTRISRNTNNASSGIMPGALDYDSGSANVDSLEDPVELVAANRLARETETLTKEEELKARLGSLCTLPEQVEALAKLMKDQGTYLQGGSIPRIKRQGLLGSVGGGAGGAGGLLGSVLGGAGNTGGSGGLLGGVLQTVTNDVLGGLLGVEPVEGLLESLLGTDGAVANLLEGLLGNEMGNGLLGGLLNSVLGNVLGENILGNLLGAVTHLLNEVLDLLRGLLGIPTLPGMPPVGGNQGSLISIPLRVEALLNILSQFQQFAGQIPNSGNNTGSTPNTTQICFDIDGSGNAAPTNSLINISPTIILNVNILSRIFNSGGTTVPGNSIRRICVTPDASGNITQIDVDNTKIQRGNKGLYSILNLSPNLLLNLNVLSQVMEFLNPGSIPSTGVGSGGNPNDICFNIDSSGNFIPSQSSLINISPTIIANLNILSKVIKSKGPTPGSGQNQRICVRPSPNGDISQIVVNGIPVQMNPRRPFSLLNLDLDLDLNINILSKVVELLNPGSGGGGNNGSSNPNEICFDIPIHSGSGNSGLINISPTIGINANILSTILGGRPQSSGATRRICIPIPSPTTAKPPVTPTPPPTRPPTTTRGPGRRCYKKICRSWRHSGGFKCHSKRDIRPAYRVVNSQ